MPVWFYYVDESFDKDKYCLAALGIRHSEWKSCFEMVHEHRRRLKERHGFSIYKEIHARDLVAGRGQLTPPDRPLTKWERSRIFLGLLELVTTLPGAHVLSVCIDKPGRRDPNRDAWEALLNLIDGRMLALERHELRLRREMLDGIGPLLLPEEAQFFESRLDVYRPRAFIISDEGREVEIAHAIRVSSQDEDSGPGGPGRILVDRIIEDPVFKPSHRSHFIQLADCIAFARLKKEVEPTPKIRKYGIDAMFDQTIAGICNMESTSDADVRTEEGHPEGGPSKIG